MDSARQNLASSFVNGFVNAGFGQDKLLMEDGNKWIYKNKEHGKNEVLFLGFISPFRAIPLSCEGGIFSAWGFIMDQPFDTQIDPPGKGHRAKVKSLQDLSLALNIEYIAYLIFIRR